MIVIAAPVEGGAVASHIGDGVLEIRLNTTEPGGIGGILNSGGNQIKNGIIGQVQTIPTLPNGYENQQIWLGNLVKQLTSNVRLG